MLKQNHNKSRLDYFFYIFMLEYVITSIFPFCTLFQRNYIDVYFGEFRLFEMGFQEQLLEIINRLPDNRQTVMFSATLPKLLVDFAKAGLNNPTLIRLDVDSKLSSNLKVLIFSLFQFWLLNSWTIFLNFDIFSYRTSLAGLTINQPLFCTYCTTLSTPRIRLLYLQLQNITWTILKT